MKLFDPKAYNLHQQRAKQTFENHSFLFNHVGAELISRLQDMRRTFSNALSLSPHPLPYPGHYHAQLEEELPFPDDSYDLIFSVLQGHWINDLKGFLKSIHGCLKEEGLFLGAIFGGKTLVELRESLLKAELSLKGGASPRIAPLLHPADAPHLLKNAGFFMPIVDTETIKVTYSSAGSLMKDLRGMGETNKLFDRPKTFTTRILFEKTEDIYHKFFANVDHKLLATFEVIYFTGWKRKKP